MSRIRGPVSALGLVLLVSACGTSGPPITVPPAPHSSTHAAATTSASPTAPTSTTPPPDSPAKLTEACPFLSIAELKHALGGDNSTADIHATEKKPDTSGGDISVTCDYGANGQTVFGLLLTGFKLKSFAVKDAVDAVPDGVQGLAKLSGIGDAAVYYTDGSEAVISTGTRSHGQTRTVIFTAPKIVPQANLEEVAKLVVGRL